jgi:6-phosphogluconate dehydrogenase (decarboxylating)
MRTGAFVMKVGFVGLGHMGSGMAASLLKAGHEVIVYNRTRAKAEPLIAQGARVVGSVADACRELFNQSFRAGASRARLMAQVPRSGAVP